MMQLILISGIVCGLGVSSLLAEPRIVCDQPVFDFGSRDASEVVIHTFELKNTGTSDLVISAVRPACGCTATELTRFTIPLGESARLAAKLTLAGRSGDIHKPILIESNDPANPAFQLLMQGKVTTEFSIFPSFLTLRQSAPNQPLSGTVQITSAGRPFRITRIESSDPSARVRADPMPDGLSQQISASLEKSPQPDPQPFLITLQTDNPRMPSVDIPAMAVQIKKIIIAPERIVLREGDEGAKKHVIIKSADGTPLEIKEISTPGPNVKVDYSATLGSIRLAVRGLSVLGDYDEKGLGVVFTNGESIQIPVVFEAR